MIPRAEHVERMKRVERMERVERIAPEAEVQERVGHQLLMA